MQSYETPPCVTWIVSPAREPAGHCVETISVPGGAERCCATAMGWEWAGVIRAEPPPLARWPHLRAKAHEQIMHPSKTRHINDARVPLVNDHGPKQLVSVPSTTSPSKHSTSV